MPSCQEGSNAFSIFNCDSGTVKKCSHCNKNMCGYHFPPNNDLTFAGHNCRAGTDQRLWDPKFIVGILTDSQIQKCINKKGVRCSVADVRRNPEKGKEFISQSKDQGVVGNLLG